MSSLFQIHPLLLLITFSSALLSPFSSAVPVPAKDNLFLKFVEFLKDNNCTMPSNVELSFPPPTSVSSREMPFGYLSDLLWECQTPDASKENDEARALCNEIFEVLENITCLQYGTQDTIRTKPFPDYNCKDFKAMKDVFPEGKNYLSKRLADDTICKLMCTGKVKYESLCKTLLWSHDVQARLKSSTLENVAKENEIGSTHKKTPPDLEKIPENITVVGVQKSSDSSSHLNSAVSQVDLKPPANTKNTDIASATSQAVTVAEKYEKSPTSVAKTTAEQADKYIPKVNSGRSESKSQQESTTNDQKVTVHNASTVEPHDKVISKIDLGTSMESDNHPVPSGVGKNLLPKVEPKIPLLQTKDSLPTKVSDTVAKDDAQVNNRVSEEKIVAASNNVTKVVENEGIPEEQISQVEDNELRNGSENFNEKKNEVNTKPKEHKIVGTVEEEKEPELTDFENPVANVPDVGDANVVRSSTVFPLLTDRDEDFDRQEEKDPDQYNNSFNQPLKNKLPAAKNSFQETSNPLPNAYDAGIVNSKNNNNGRFPDNIQMISSFPEQEDSHFFFYFLSIVLILMAGYLIFHNKQKIIALIVEGRHERRRRSHGGGYKKLETK